MSLERRLDKSIFKDNHFKIRDEDGIYDAVFECSSLTAHRLFTFPDASGTFALESFVTDSYVPYAGATTVVDLNNQNLVNVGDLTGIDNLTMGSASVNAGVFSMIQGAVASDPTFSITQSRDNVTIAQTVGLISINAPSGGLSMMGAVNTNDTLTVASDLTITTGKAFFTGDDGTAEVPDAPDFIDFIGGTGLDGEGSGDAYAGGDGHIEGGPGGTATSPGLVGSGGDIYIDGGVVGAGAQGGAVDGYVLLATKRGTVGIGTATTPTYTFEVGGEAVITGDTSTTGDAVNVLTVTGGDGKVVASGSGFDGADIVLTSGAGSRAKYYGGDGDGGDVRINPGATTLGEGGGSDGDIYLCNLQGNVMVGAATPTHRFAVSSTDDSDQIAIGHDNTDGWIKWTDGYLILTTDEGANTDSYVEIKGKGNGEGHLLIYDENNSPAMHLTCQSGKSYIYTDGAGELNLNHSAEGDVKLFSLSADAETKELQVYGFPSGLSKKYGYFKLVDIGSAPYFQIATDGTGLSLNGITHIGDGATNTNYTKFEADGTLEFNGTATVWRDINVGAAVLSRPASSQPDEGNFLDEAGADTGITTLAYAIGEKASGAIEMQHDYKEGSNFTFHVHWQGIAAPSGTDNVQWRLTYVLFRDDTTLDAVTIIDSPDVAIDTQYKCYRSDVVAIDGSTKGNNGSSVTIGDQLLFTIERVTSTGDAYAGDALVATVGVHYELDTVGSRTITAK